MTEWFIRQMEQLADWIGAFRWPDGRHRNQIVAGALAAVVAVGLAFSALFGCATAPPEEIAEQDTPLFIRIEPGMDADSVGQMLSARGIIDSRFFFWLTAKVNGLESKFQTGTYKMHRGMDTAAVLDMLVQGDVAPARFTIPEGFNVNEIAERLEKEGIARAVDIRAEAVRFAPYKYMLAAPEAAYRAEGFLFPDTYEVEPGMTAKSILHMMADNFDDKMTDAMRQRAMAEGLSLYDLVTLASLVEKEARFDEDRPIIAQVFLKRLRLGMPLQSDTTIQYLLDAPKEDITYADTEIESPYNTYQNEGLPPGPIANPGLDSIEAVLYPADTDYLYFVADRQGHNHYSMTYEEHLSIVEQVR